MRGQAQFHRRNGPTTASTLARPFVSRSAGAPFPPRYRPTVALALVAASRNAAMTDLLLEHAGGRHANEFNILADGKVVGHIMLSFSAPTATPWMWALAYGQHTGRSPTHGYESTRDAAMKAFSRCWHRE